MTRQNKTLSLSILSGKGGVGKTNIALNIGYALNKAGHSVLLMDCDLGLANLDVLLGISPEHNLLDLLNKETHAEDVVVSIEPQLDFLPAATGLPELIELDEDIQNLLLKKLERLFSDYDYLILDLGAGINPTVLTFASITREKLVIITPEPTSLTDSYAMIKILSSQYGCRDFQVVVNMAETKKEADMAFGRLEGACEKFLGFGLSYLGSIGHDKTVHDAVRKQIPLVKLAPRSKAGGDIIALAAKLHSRRNKLLHRLIDQPVLAPLPSGTPPG